MRALEQRDPDFARMARQLAGMVGTSVIQDALDRFARGARASAAWCGWCGIPIGATEPVVRTTVRTARASGRQILSVVCTSCAPHGARFPRICGVCDRPFSTKRSEHLACCGDHDLVVRQQQRRLKRKNARGKRRCDQCGDRYQPVRTDSAFCSSACRQKAYRERQKKLGASGI